MLEIIITNNIAKYLVVFILLFLEYANFPIPGTMILPLIGVLSFKYKLNIVLVLIMATIGGILGALLSYYLGNKIGKPFIIFLNKKFKSTVRTTKKSYDWIKKHDKKALLLSRLFPVARGFISIVAGVINMKLKDFIIFSTLGIFIWNVITINLGYFIGDNITYIISNIENGSIIILLLVVVIYYAVKHYKNKKQILLGDKNGEE